MGGQGDKPMTTFTHVDQVLVAMLKAWPTLRGSRLDCLHVLATGSEYDAKWNEDGSLWVSDEKTTDTSFPDKTEDEDDEVVRGRAKIAAGGKGAKWETERLADRLLTLRARALRESFTRDNAEEIILAGNSYDPEFKDYPNARGWENTLPGKSFTLLDNVPENADPLWIEAFIEMLEEVLRFKYPAYKFDGMAADYSKRYLDDLENAKVAARETLIRLKGTDVEKVQLARDTVQRQIDALMKQAAEMGVKVSAKID
jgi:hypothetical protein